VKGQEIPEIFTKIPEALEGFVESTREYLEKAIRIGGTNMDTVKNRFTIVENNIQ
jgi:hypothetical protein